MGVELLLNIPFLIPMEITYFKLIQRPSNKTYWEVFSMTNRKRKHGIFAVNGDVVVLSNVKEERIDFTHINYALETVFNQMRIAGNRSRTIESYEYILNSL